MNYDETLTNLIAHLSQDKGIPQPHRNAVTSSARRLQLEIRGALTMTNLDPPVGTMMSLPLNRLPLGQSGPEMVCICAPGMRNKSCPAAVHVG